MMPIVFRPRVGLVAAVVLMLPLASVADEGMWLLTNPPTELLRDRYGFEPSAEWLEHLQKSAVHMGGGSASLISPDGLVMTNHHVGVDQLQKLSSAERNLLATGFWAPTRDQELKCPDLEVRILWTTEDVTSRVESAAKPGQSPAEAHDARRQEMTRIEQESRNATGLDSEVVTLYHGARYHLYRYKRYDDVRLVMAPEQGIAFFGGDTDNFEYPRFNLDCCFFRIYENDKPLRAEHYLRWSPNGGADGELMFVFGHPGRTDRQLTVDHLKFMRDRVFPDMLEYLWREEVRLTTFCNRDAEHARIGRNDLLGVQNGRKARTGGYAGLLDPRVFRSKAAEEERLRKATGTDGRGDPWARIAAAHQTYQSFYNRHRLLRGGRPFTSDLYQIAFQLVRLGEELPKSSAERLREYRDSELESVYLRLYSPAPIYDELEIFQMTGTLSLLAQELGADDPLVLTALDGKSPEDRAVELVRGCKLRDIETRKRLVKEGKAGIEASLDPMIRLALALDPEARALRKRYEDEVESVERECYAQLGAIRFKLLGESVYPDATGTLRMAFGRIRGFQELGKTVAPFTNFAGLYERWKARSGDPQFELPKRWIERRDRLDLSTPFNFVLTADIIGGNSGSPVVNKRGEVTGLIFDGNIQSLILDFVFTEEQARAVAVDSRALLEALEKIYDAKPLVEEIRRAAAAAPDARDAGAQSLFDGKSLDGWKILTDGVFSGNGKVLVEDGAMVLEAGNLQTGVAYTGEFPRDQYEVSWEGRRVKGNDFFCGLTFPVGGQPCTLILGGWGGSVVGLSNVDGMSAAENPTTTGRNFENGRWYSIRLRVTRERIQAWIDDDSLIDLPRGERQFSVWAEQEPCKPFGFSTWNTAGALRNIKVRRLGPGN